MFEFTQFAYPKVLWLLLLLLPLAVWYFFKIKNAHPALTFSSTGDFGNNPITVRKIIAFAPYVLNFVIIALIIVALARPQSTSSSETITKEGIDIVMAMDVSGSMLARDFKPNRLEAAKNVASDFIQGRENDRIGIVLFSGESFTQCPLTADKATLVNLMSAIREGMIEDGTAIGLGLANAVARLKNSDAKSKIVILLTDGVNNMGEIDPVFAAEIAARYGIRVYTIGVGKNGLAPFPVQDPFGRVYYENMEVRIDEPTLKKISSLTDGQYFRATDNFSLKEIYTEIDKLEKTKMQTLTMNKTHDRFMPWLLAAAVLIVVNMLIKMTLGRFLP